MILPRLPLVIKSSGIDIEDILPDVIKGNVTFSEILHFCKMNRRIGICFLFLEGIPDNFFRYLFKSGRAFLHYLQTRPNDFKNTGQSTPFFDAIVCNDFKGAELISLNSRKTWNEGEEYEDDYYYYYFLMNNFFILPNKSDLIKILEKYESVLEGNNDIRFDLCKALFDKNQEDFDNSIGLFLEEKKEYYNKKINSDRLEPDDAATVAKISIEGLSLIRFAEVSGLKTYDEYLLIPSSARIIQRSNLEQPETWKVLNGSYYDLK